ncbi:MAG TPA: aminotransferase class IV [Polyangiaceae bacterium]
MTSLAMIDGALCAPEDAQVSVYDRGFLYGDSVFEALRTYRGEPFALGEHAARLAASAERVAIPLPIPIAELESEVRTAIAAAKNPESYVRVMLTRGRSKGPGLGAASGAPLRVILVSALEAPAPALYEAGIAAVTFATQRVADVLAVSEAKLGNYLLSVLALQRAAEAGAQEALIVDASDNVLEGSTSNVFAVVDGAVLTPPIAGILAGITRAKVLELCAELGLTVRQGPLPKLLLAGVHELFITSSIREIVPVVRVDGTPIGNGAPGPITLRLLAAFRAKFH